jgi:hypothetical protein
VYGRRAPLAEAPPGVVPQPWVVRPVDARAFDISAAVHVDAQPPTARTAVSWAQSAGAEVHVDAHEGPLEEQPDVPQAAT